MILSALEPFMFFSVLYDCITVTGVMSPSHFCPSPRIKKSKMKLIKKMRKEKEKKVK